MFKDIIQKIKAIWTIGKADKNTIREKYLAQIRNALVKRYRANPCSKKKLMKEADQFGDMVWNVYRNVGITRDDISQMIDEVISEHS